LGLRPASLCRPHEQADISFAIKPDRSICSQQWKDLPIEKDRQGRPEIHYTRIYRAFRRWQADGCFDAIFEGSVFKLHQDHRLDITVIHGDGTTTAAKKGGDNLGFSGHRSSKATRSWSSAIGTAT